MQKLLSIFLSFSFSLLAASINAQYNIAGVILDSATREPLGAASVFCQNTTLGTTANKQGEFSLQLKSGGYDLIFTYTGYKTQTIRATGTVSHFEVLMLKEEKSLEDVIVRSSNEVKDGWNKYGSFFVDNFIGATPNGQKCKLQNPTALKFYFLKKSNKLRVLATEPLQINNEALGYQLNYALDSFVYFYNTNSSTYKGYCLYTEMEGSDSLKGIWTTNRKSAYEGSKLHFMRSYYDSSLQVDGWLVEMLTESDAKKFDKIENPYDTIYYGGLDSVGSEIEIWYPRKISISYTNKRPETEYLQKFKLSKYVSALISYIDIKDWIAIKENGYYYDQKDWVNQGYWSWKNLGDQLPYDYAPIE